MSHSQYTYNTVWWFYYVWILLYHFHKIYIGGKTLFNYTNLFSPNDYKKNGKIIYKYFKDKYAQPWLYAKKIDHIRNYILDGIKSN